MDPCNDCRGHGQSGVPSGSCTIERLGRDALAIMDGLGLETVNWCGLSIGGMVGMWLGANAPQRLDNPARTADQQRPGQRRIAYPVPPEFLGLWNSELLSEKRAGPGVDELGQ